MKQLMYSNADEYTKIESVRLEDQFILLYDKMKNFSSSIGEDDGVRELLGSSYSQISGNIQVARECLASYKILEPTLEDISLVNDKIHYSTVYNYDTLDKMRMKVNEAPFVWLGIRAHEFQNAEGKSDMLVFGGDVIVDGVNLGTVILSVNLTYLQMEGETETNSAHMIVWKDGSVYPLNCSPETMTSVYNIWMDKGREENIRRIPYYIHSRYFDEMDCYLLSALNVKNVSGGMSRVSLLIWGCVLLVIAFCFC